MDYRHHPTDVIAGGLIGIGAGWWGYRQYYPVSGLNFVSMFWAVLGLLSEATSSDFELRSMNAVRGIAWR
jgi:membrane-associated phospholipid phosphatase